MVLKTLPDRVAIAESQASATTARPENRGASATRHIEAEYKESSVVFHLTLSQKCLRRHKAWPYRNHRDSKLVDVVVYRRRRLVDPCLAHAVRHGDHVAVGLGPSD